jgi:3-oxoacyl-[acyl-carrier-protein] synthase II
MQQALDEAGVTGNDVDYVNAHATSTPVGDEIEALAIAHATHDGVMVSATKVAKGSSLQSLDCLHCKRR